MNFKGIQTFLKKSDKFYKIPYPHLVLDYKFALTHLYSNIRSSSQMANRTRKEISKKSPNLNLKPVGKYSTVANTVETLQNYCRCIVATTVTPGVLQPSPL
jgi:hypothetical protein